MTAGAHRDRLGFVCAMPMELRPLSRMLSLRRTEIGGLAVSSGSFGTTDAFAVVTGMGTRLATQGTRRLLDAVTLDHVLVVGITGALESSTPIGSLVFPEVVVDAATGAEHRPSSLGTGTPAGTMWTGDELVTDSEVLAGLRDRGVVALDMETAAIADVCESRGVPWSVFRAISDRANDGGLDEEVFHLSNQDGTPNTQAVLRYLLRHPSRLPWMLRLARGATRAADAAAAAALRAWSGSPRGS